MATPTAQQIREARKFNREVRDSERKALDNAQSTQERREIKREASNLMVNIPRAEADNSRSQHTNTGRSKYVKPSGAVLRKEEEERISTETTFDEVKADEKETGTSSLPVGSAVNDVLYWGDGQWVTLDAPGSNATLSVVDGSIQWDQRIPDGVNENDILEWDGGSWVPVANTGLPEGVSNNDILRFNGTSWVILPAPASVDPLALTVENGSMSWEETSVSEFTEETIDYVKSGNTPGSKIFLTKEVPV